MQRIARTALSISALVLGAAPASAEVPGSWHVTGAISGRAFSLDCRFVPKGNGFGGTCVDAAGGETKAKRKSYELTQGSVNGGTVHWAYPAKVMFMSIDINFTGAMNGNRITGKVSAKGRDGAFTAVRQ